MAPKQLLSSPIVLMIAGALGGGLAIGFMLFASIWSDYPLFSIPFATSIVLVMGSPDAEPAQPRALIGGHLVSSLVGFAVLYCLGPGPYAAAIAVALSIIAMHVTGTFHPPAGIDPLLIALNGLPLSFFLVPVSVGALLLSLFAYAWHRLIFQRPWPVRWF